MEIIASTKIPGQHSCVVFKHHYGAHKGLYMVNYGAQVNACGSLVKAIEQHNHNVAHALACAGLTD